MPSKTEPEQEALLATPASTPPKPLSKFKRLSSVVSLYEPPSASSPSSPNDPTTVLFCSWTNATPKHIDYYTRSYMRLYPSARIILVTISTKQFIFESESRRRKDVAQAVTALLADADDPDDPQKLHVHSLSNGGAKRVYNIAAAYRLTTGKILQIKSHVIDSAPGIPRFRRDIHALTVPARKLPLLPWLMFMAITYVVVAVVYVAVNWMPYSFWHQLVWGPTFGYYDKELFDERCLKAYVYSKEDLAIDWRDVESHASVTEEKGYRVLRKLVDGAEHAQMFRGKGGEEDYWGWVQRVWGLAIGVGEK